MFIENKRLTVHIFTEGLKKSTYAYSSLEAFAQGVKASGDQTQLITRRKYKACDVAVIFGDVREGKGKGRRMPFKAEVKGRHIRRGLIVIDTAVLTRGSHVGAMYRRIGLNGLLRNEADFDNTDMISDRWLKISKHMDLKLRPWRTEGEHITIALQRPFDASLKTSERLRPEKYKEWLLALIAKLQIRSHLPIHIRPHPGSMGQEKEKRWLETVKAEISEDVLWDERNVSFEESMQGCILCITYNSGAGVDAVLLGVPTMTCDPGSFAWDVSIHDPIQWNPFLPFTPSRQQWLNDLSYVEWSIEEIEQGLPWQHLRKSLIQYL